MTQSTATIKVLPIEQNEKEWASEFLLEHSKSDRLFAGGREYFLFELLGFKAVQDDRLIGLVLYHIAEAACRIITIHSLVEGMGFGTELLKAASKAGVEAGCKRVCAGVTNDNTDALRFFQTRGFIVAHLHKNVAETYRELNPDYPERGAYDIRIRDEFELEINF